MKWITHTSGWAALSLGVLFGLGGQVGWAQEFPCGPSPPGSAACPNDTGLMPCPDVFGSAAAFKILTAGGDVIAEVSLEDLNTSIGRSDPFLRGFANPSGEQICSGGTAPFADTLEFVADPCRFPQTWIYEGNDFRRQVQTEILSLELKDAADTVIIRAGQDFFDSVAGTPQEEFFQHSTGKVTSRYGPACRVGDPLCSPPSNCDCVDDFSRDFMCSGTPCQSADCGAIGCPDLGCCFGSGSAQSIFNLFVEIEIAVPGIKLYNKTPIVVSAPIGEFPPDLGLPGSTYIHDPNFGAVPLFDENGLHWGFILSAGHGGSGVTVPPVDAPLGLPCPASFTVDSTSLGLDPAFTMAPPNHVFDDGNLPEVPLTVYLSSGANPGQIPDKSNVRSPQVVGNIPGGFVAGDAINSFSFGRDGTIDPTQVCPDPSPTDGTIFFSVSRDSLGQMCNETPNPGDIYAAGGIAFGKYTDAGAIFVPRGSNVLVADATALGLRPALPDPTKDDLTGLELKVFDPSSHLFYATYVGSSFPAGTGMRATIFVYDPSTGPFELANLTEFAFPVDMGLQDDDVIDAMVLSDATPGAPEPCPQEPDGVMQADFDEVLFSLAPGSPSLGGGSPADIFQSSFNGTFMAVLDHDDLGLRQNGPGEDDDVDALDIKPNDFGSITGACCLPSGGCLNGATQTSCTPLGGTYQGDGTMCLGDSDGDGNDDLCVPPPAPPAFEWGLVTSVGPSARWGHAMAYHALNQMVVLFGGSGPTNNQTWKWDGNVWTQPFPVGVPSSRLRHQMAYHAGTAAIILFGGQDASNVFGDTWRFNGNDWVQLSPANTPPARFAHTMAYDAARDVIVMFGGLDSNTVFLNDTWEWNGTNWVERFPGTTPTPRASAMAYDSIRNVTVLYGGGAFGGDETWEWDGGNWMQRFPANDTGLRNGHKMAFDAALGVTLLYGGNSGANLDLWAYDGNDWSAIAPSAPGLRSEHAMAYDAARRQVVLYGGVQGAAGVSGETWVFPAASVSRAFQVLGSSSGIGWSWCINELPGPGFSVCDLNVPGVPMGGSAEDLVNQFVDTINASGCSGVQAVATGSVFTVTIGGNQGFSFCVGPFGQQPTCCLPPSPSCSFNPSVEEVVLTGVDCNGNGIDDAIDIANGTSDDLNADGVPDECVGVIPTVSEWGLIVMTVLLMTAGTVVLGRQRRSAAA